MRFVSTQRDCVNVQTSNSTSDNGQVRTARHSLGGSLADGHSSAANCGFDVPVALVASSEQAYPKDSVSKGSFQTAAFERVRGSRVSQKDYAEVRQSPVDGLYDSDEESVGKTRKVRSMAALLHEGVSLSNPERSLAVEAIPPLVISVIGLMLAGWLLDVVQHWDVFKKVKELFILVPVLLNLKGNLEMNLASRLSTSANLGELDKQTSRSALVWGNLALLQVQALIVGAIAGVFSVAEGVMFHQHDSGYSESMLVIVASMVCAALSSMILGTFMCALVIVSRKFRINPDNIACPMASSLGDLLTLVILAICSSFLLKHIDTWLSTLLFLILSLCIPIWACVVWSNKYVQNLLISGWSPLVFAMTIASVAGLLLEQYIGDYSGLALVTPVLNGITGNLGCIYASRISTRLHSGSTEDYASTEKTLLFINTPIQLIFLILAWWLDPGNLTWEFSLEYVVVTIACACLTLTVAKKLTLWLWHHKYDPDNYSLPYITAIVDVIGTVLLVLSYQTASVYVKRAPAAKKLRKHPRKSSHMPWLGHGHRNYNNFNTG